MTKPGYTYLTTFRLSEVIHVLTKKFLGKFGRLERLGRRQQEQMEQAARSGKQNIAEGYSQGTSLKGYIKLTGIAKGSLEELKLDFEDFLKEKNLEIWGKEHPKIQEYRKFRVKVIGEVGGRDVLNIPQLPQSPQESSNFLITLISLNIYLLGKQIKSLEEKHQKEGGFTEKLYKSRIDYRRSHVS